MTKFMDLYNLIKLIKVTTCVKGTDSCIDLLLTKVTSALQMMTSSLLQSAKIQLQKLLPIFVSFKEFNGWIKNPIKTIPKKSFV